VLEVVEDPVEPRPRRDRTDPVGGELECEQTHLRAPGAKCVSERRHVVTVTNTGDTAASRPWDPGVMDALLIIDASPDRFPQSPPQPLVDLIAPARGVGGVIVHVAEQVAQDSTDAEAAETAEPADDETAPQPQIDSVVGTREDELVLVSSVPDAFEGVEDLAEGL